MCGAVQAVVTGSKNNILRIYVWCGAGVQNTEGWNPWEELGTKKIPMFCAMLRSKTKKG